MLLMRYQILLLFLLSGTIQPMEKPIVYNQELTNKLTKRRQGYPEIADNYLSYWPEIKKLIENGADPNSKLDFGNVMYTAVLNFVIAYGTPQDARFLLDYGATIRFAQPIQSALGYAVFWKRKEFVKLLLELGIDRMKSQIRILKSPL